MKKNALLIIDPQNDFCNPGDVNGKGRGSLYVEGAEKDMQRLAKWIKENKESIDFIGITIDSHQPNDISHPNFWMDKDGNFPAPFTPITYKDVEEGKWTARFDPKRSLAYLKELEAQGEYPHLIWPVHCLIGSTGAAIYQPLMDAIIEWTVKGKFYQTVAKGTFPFTEHFGAFRAQVPDPERPETQLNQGLIKTLETYQNIYLAGEAKSHCVANSLKQVLDESPDLAAKFIVIEDAMSNVTGFETLADPIYKRAKQMGVRFTTTKVEKLVIS
ncbi:MAG: isochorismatase family protein [Bacteroidales bacterium]|nr:isochorismatase family protein [Bacteroidales bacterium]